MFLKKMGLHFWRADAYNKKNQCIRSVGVCHGNQRKQPYPHWLPRDVILGDVLISFVGRSQVNVENYRSILIYTDTLIKLQARNCRVVIHGARLKIDYYTAEEMKITGQIGSLEFET